MTIVLDAGALIAIDRGSRELEALLAVELRAGRTPRTIGGVVAQAWRDGRRQAVLAPLLAATDVVDLGHELGRRTGELLARTQTADVIDAALVLLALPGDEIWTSDPNDIAALVVAARLDVGVLTV